MFEGDRYIAVGYWVCAPAPSRHLPPAPCLREIQNMSAPLSLIPYSPHTALELDQPVHFHHSVGLVLGWHGWFSVDEGRHRAVSLALSCQKQVVQHFARCAPFSTPCIR